MKLIPTVVDRDDVAVEAVTKAGVCHGQIVDALAIIRVIPASEEVPQTADFRDSFFRKAKVVKLAPRNRTVPIPAYLPVSVKGELPEVLEAGYMCVPVRIISNGDLLFILQGENARFIHESALEDATQNFRDALMAKFEQCGESLCTA